MPLHDKAIPENARCPTCSGSGWTWWEASEESERESTWIICRECRGTGRADKTGRKRNKPADPPGA